VANATPNRGGMKVKLKVNPSEGGRCDFCQTEEATHTINGGLWWICRKCMNAMYGGEEE
jgi:ribosomal protein L37AE/L43A